MKFLKVIPLIFFASLLSCSVARAADIQFRFVLNDAEAFAENFHNYIYTFDETGKNRNVTVADKVFLSKTDIEAIEVRFLAGSSTNISFFNFVLTEDAAKKLAGLGEKFPKKELAVMVNDAIFKVTHLPFGQSGKIPISARQIVTIDDARKFAGEIDVKFISPEKTAQTTPGIPSVPSKVLAA